ncbi:GIY-YIG nuclease family protein [candidate division KSB1 bacterium]|nr:GIY-YIG nuclease family protein [candidate division KSB1 bacterium]
MDRGAYVLLIHLEKNRCLRIGKLGKLDFPAGYYAYVGSAMQGLRARVERHRKKRGKKVHWHVDYLLADENARIVATYLFPSPNRNECQVAEKVKGSDGVQIIAPGFGASDCRSRCRSHLFYLGSNRPFCREIIKDVAPPKLGVRSYARRRKACGYI